MTHQSIVSHIVNDLEQAWNAGDGARFGSVFADDADFVNSHRLRALRFGEAGSYSCLRTLDGSTRIARRAGT